MAGVMVFIQILVGGAALAILAWPFFSSREPWDLNENPDRLRNLKRSRDRALRVLKDLETDYREGSLAPDDYRDLQASYRQEAIRISKELSRVREAVIRQVAGGPAKPLSADERRRLEGLIAQRKKKRLAGNTPASH